LFDQRDQVTLRKYFQDFDKDNDGNITFAEFSEVLGKFKLEPRDIDVNHSKKEINTNVIFFFILFYF